VRRDELKPRLEARQRSSLRRASVQDHAIDQFETVVARDVETGDLERLPIAGLRAIESADPPPPAPDFAELDDRDWAEAHRRLDLIKPVLEGARLPRSVMAQRARDAGVEVTTRYRWAPAVT
jgi:putative transposase